MIRALLMIATVCLGSFASAKTPTFRLHQSREPSLLDPHRLRSGSSQYLIQNLFRNLLKHDEKLVPVPDLAESCVREPSQMVIVCKLRANLRWSDGRPLTARDFLAAYQRILSPETQAPRADLLFSVKGAEALYKKGTGSFGVSLRDAQTLRFELTKPDPDFEHKLVSPLLAPFRPPEAGKSPDVFSGPYKIKTWQKGKKIRLAQNPHYPLGAADRPEVEILFIEDDGVALKLFEKNELDFLRRLPTLFIPQFQKTSEFHWIPLLRLDYFGFGPRLRNRDVARDALTASLNYSELQKIFHSDGLPGCPGIPSSWYGGGVSLCHSFDPKKARTLFTAKEKQTLEPLRLTYSNVGGEDHRRAAEWIQDQLNKYVDLKVQARGLENKMFLSSLKSSPSDLFRRGVSAERPTCRAFLEVFQPGHPENYLKVMDQEFQKTLKELMVEADPAKAKKLCHQALSFLMENHLFIPTGEIHFAVLAKTGFTGWHLNGMGYLDLSGLRGVQK